MSILPVTVDNRLCIPRDALSAELEEGLKQATTHENPKYKSNQRQGISVAKELPYYETFGYEYRGETECFTIPLGAIASLRSLAKQHSLTLKFTDNRTTGELVNPGCVIPNHTLDLYPYQEEAVTEAIKKQVCIIRAPTGSGKTSTAIAILASLKLPTLVIVWSTNLFDQWVTRIQKELGIPKSEIGVIRGKTSNLKPVTVAMQQTLAKNPGKYASQFGVVICDEVQRFAAKTFMACVDPFRSKYRIGISADESRKDKKEFLIYDLFGSVAYEVKQPDLIKAGYVLDVAIIVIPTEFKHPSYRYDRDFNALLEKMKTDDERNNLATYTIAKEVKLSNQVFAMSHRREHCLLLDNQLTTRYGITAGLLIGGPEYATLFKETRSGLESGRLRVGVGTIPAVGQGLDIPSVGRAVIVSPIATNRQLFGQVRGRVCRTSKSTGKQDAKMYYLWDQHVYGKRPLENLISWYPNVFVQNPDGSLIPAKDYLKSRKPVTRDELGFVVHNPG